MKVIYSLDYLIFIFNICIITIVSKIEILQFISSDVYGILGSAFIDFGENFDIYDSTGEEPKDIFIGSITKVRVFNYEINSSNLLQH